MKDLFLLLVMLIGFALFFSSKWAFEYFGLSCFEQLPFHLKVPLEGTNTEFIIDWFKTCGLKTILCMLLWILLYRVSILQKYYYTISVLLYILMILYAAHTVKMFEWIINQFRKTNIYEDSFVDTNTVKLTFPNKKRNLIYIYVESLETTYTSKKNGGNYPYDLIPDLSKLAKDHINFSHQSELGGAHVVAGTGWTTGGIVASTAGVGLTVPLMAPGFKDGKPFLSHTKALGDILEEEGYNQEYCIGSDATFGGRKFYFDQHGHFKIFDYPYAKSKLPDNYHVFWGFEDEKLFDFAKTEILDLADQSQPFHFSMLTVDTHHPKGYKDKHYQDKFPERLSNIIYENSRKVGEFVHWIQDQPFYENTTVVICGDHTSMAAQYIYDTYEADYDRTTMNIIINGVKSAKNNKNRIFTSFDLFPTVLSAIGVYIPNHRLGFGTDLYSNKKTIPEQIGLERFDKELRKQSGYYWNHIL